MRNLWLIFASMGLAAAAGYGACRAAGWDAHGREMVAAGAVAAGAALLALLPAFLARHGPVAAVSQAALLGTVVHMFLVMLLAAFAWLLGLIGERTAFLFWLTGFYLASLVALVAAVLGLIRRASPGAAAAEVRAKQV